MLAPYRDNERAVGLNSSEAARLTVLEDKIAAGLRTFVEVGLALVEIRDGRLYREAYRTFDSYCRDRWGFGRRHAYQVIDAAAVVQNVRNCAQTGGGINVPLPANEAQARPLAGLAPYEQGEAWLRAVESAPGGRVTAAHVASVVRDAQRPAGSAVHYSSQCQEWYTPPHVIEAVVASLGGIDLDPASNSHSEPVVPAAQHFTAADDGLSSQWFGRVFLNPPYGNTIGLWTGKLRTEYEAGYVDAAIALVPARTDTQWFRALSSYPRCFLHGRLSFSGSQYGAPFPSSAFFLGQELDRFVAAFAHLGDTFARIGR
jgi:hypothetical protein